MTPLQEQFVAETRELIQQATDDLIALEREGFDDERIERVFRAFHTLKGSAGVVELPAMSLTLHAAEDLLAAIQTAQVELTSNVIDRALACLDLVSGWVDDFASHGSISSNAGEAAVAMKEQLANLFVPSTSRRDGPSASVTAKTSHAPWVSRLIEEARRRTFLDAEEHGQLVAVAYEPRADCFFNGDDPLRTMRKVPHMLALQIEARETWPPLSELDPYSCNLRLQCLTRASRSELADIFRLVPDQVRMVDVSPSELHAEEAGPANDRSLIPLVRSIIEEQLRMVRSAAPNEGFTGRVGSATRVISNALCHGSRQSLVESIERAHTAAISANNVGLLVAAVEKTLSLLISGESASSELAAMAEPKASRSARLSLRVDESKIDALGNLASELVLLKNSFAHLAKRVEDQLPGHDVARSARHEFDNMERLSGDLHAAVLELRMVPVVQLFRPFPRLVRDMAQSLDKKVRLVTEGATTEADKAIIDRLFEPLMHLIRNALDHGIEPPERRRRNGKPELATVNLRASRAGNRFVLEVTDDGGGIDPEIVKRKAIERGLLPAGTNAMSEEQVASLIFSSGFSTAGQISDISGRGVGMDVVRTTVEKMDGHVSMTSTVGMGTTVRLDLPANIAISRVMVVEAGGQLFGIPMDMVTETIRLSPDRISQIKNNAAFVLRDRVVPIFALAEAMDLPRPAAADDATRLFIVTDTGGKIAALEVDEIHDRLEVVLKPMQGLLSGARGYAGTTLLGDGRVLLVLDLKEIAP